MGTGKPIGPGPDTGGSEGEAGAGDPSNGLTSLLEDIRNCRLCETSLPLGPRPVVRAKTSARILIAGQAPGTKVHETGIPWNDRSGDRLRDWLGLDRDRFYDDDMIAIVPQGFCYPGRAPKGGDLPPRPECSATWHERLLRHLGAVRLTLVVGQYAQRWHLGAQRASSLTETVRAWKNHWPHVMPLPHPSWRNTAWLKRHPWFERELLPVLQDRIRDLIDE